MWYTAIINAPSQPIDNYHIFKSLPSFLIKFSLQFLGLKANLDNIHISFRILNFLSVFISIIIANKICDLKNLNKDQKVFYTIITFISFLIIKISYYDAITPDYFGLCLSFISLYLIESKFCLQLLLK